MVKDKFDIIVIGAGSGGLSVGLFMSRAGFKVLMVSKSDQEIGGDCLNDGCVPSKALIHAAKIVQHAKEATQFGVEINEKVDIKKVISYIKSKQSIIRAHENAQWLQNQGVTVALGNASFVGRHEIEVNGTKYSGKKIVIATGSKPRRLKVEGIGMVDYFDNESIFHLDALPERILCIGGGPIGIEIAQALSRLGSQVAIVNHGSEILEHDDPAVTSILLEQLEKEGIKFLLESSVEKFTSATKPKSKQKLVKLRLLISMQFL